jgi:hypothetical protein
MAVVHDAHHRDPDGMSEHGHSHGLWLTQPYGVVQAVMQVPANPLARGQARAGAGSARGAYDRSNSPSLAPLMKASHSRGV